MKKYLFGMLAIVLAIGFSAFTKPAKKKTGDPLIFEYNSTSGGGFSKTAVQTEANWDYVGIYDGESVLCDDEQAPFRACQIVVDDQYATPNGPSDFDLTSNVIVTASGATSANGFVDKSVNTLLTESFNIPQD